MPFDQAGRLLEFRTQQLPSDSVLIVGMEGADKISHPFAYQLEIYSEDEEIDALNMMGEACKISLARYDAENVHFHGKIWKFSAGEYYSQDAIRAYHLEIVPAFKFLCLNQNSRIFQDKKIPEIIEQVLKDNSVSDYSIKLSSTYAKLEFCVQWRESDYDFVHRLMRDAGIFYYYVHDDTKSTMVVADSAKAYAKAVSFEAAFDRMYYEDHSGEGITFWQPSCEMIPGSYASRDYNFETPAATLDAKEKTTAKLKAAKAFEVFDYPGGYGKAPDGKAIAVSRMESMERSLQVVRGKSDYPAFFAGAKFRLAKHAVAAEQGKEYTLVAVSHKVTDPYDFDPMHRSYLLAPREEELYAARSRQKRGYSNQFECVPSDTPYRPLFSGPGPQIVGPQPAKVVGPKNDEVYTDKYGRIKVAFPWDREGKADEKSSCWMRVSQDWAGKNWGTFFLPRVGSEVLVEFVNGDPNRPIVTGRVHNAEQGVPHTLPDYAFRSGVKTSNTKGKGFHELRFEDKSSKEHIYFRSEKDFVRLVKGSDALDIGYDKTSFGTELDPAPGGDPGSQTINIKANRTVVIAEGHDKLEIAKGNQTLEIAKGNQTTILKTGDHKLQIKAGQSTIEAAKQIVLKVGGNSIKLDAQGITISGTKVSIEGKLSAEMKATQVTVGGNAMLTLKGGVVKIN